VAGAGQGDDDVRRGADAVVDARQAEGEDDHDVGGRIRMTGLAITLGWGDVIAVILIAVVVALVVRWLS